MRAAVGELSEEDTPLWHSWPMVLIPEHDALRATHFVVDCMRAGNTRLFLEGSDELAPFTGQGRARPCRGALPLADRRFHVDSTRDIRMGDLLGAGGFSKVFQVSVGGEQFAVKRVPRKIIEKVGLSAVTNEASLLAAIDHPHVVRTVRRLQHCLHQRSMICTSSQQLLSDGRPSRFSPRCASTPLSSRRMISSWCWSWAPQPSQSTSRGTSSTAARGTATCSATRWSSRAGWSACTPCT